MNSPSECDNEKHVVHNPYDSLFKAFMSNIAVAKDFFAMQLPPEIYQKINTEKLFLCPQSFVDHQLKHKHVDVLYRTEFDEKVGYIYILTEQQTEPDANLPFRIMQYVMRIIEHHQKQFKTAQFPVVYPLIYYVGKKPYKFSTDFYDGFAHNKALAKHLLTNPFPLTQITQVQEEKLEGHPLAGTLVKVYQLAYARDFMLELAGLERFFKVVDSYGYVDLILSVLQFLLNGFGKSEGEKIMSMVSQMVTKESKRKIMTIAEKMQQKWMNQTIQLVAKKMLAERISEELIAKTTGLSLSEIKKLKKELFEIHQ
ncbi:MAG: Rpn family recombination-promoting nuclease/putative transposase [Gammaproteobacteria bacterium]|nr:Rpn family recombination-promoting nuclease/putative transposase [Gammaproteobacteria bacterium]